MAIKKAPIFGIWDDARIERPDIKTREKLAELADVDLKWLNDFFNDGKIAEQYIRIKRIEKVLNIPPLPERYYRNPED